jgi:LysM repeat protein
MGNSFIFDDEEQPEQQPEGDIYAESTPGPSGEEQPNPEENDGNNRTFLLAIGILGGIVLLALVCLAVYAGFILPRQKQAAAVNQAQQLAQNTQMAQAATATALAGVQGPTYTVQPGDTLAIIAARFAISVDDLRNANPGLGAVLTPGQVINLPPRYTVQPGDTLLSIAARFGINVNDLRNANPGLGDVLTPGLVIVLPPPVYTVQPGDTLASIAARLGIALETLKNANPGVSDNPTPGQAIKLPGGVSLITPVAAVAATNTPVVVFASSTPVLVATVNPITATVGAAYTQAALAQLTVIPTSTALGAVPSTGFADEVGLPVLLIAGAVFLVLIFLVRRVRTARAP